MHKSQHAPKGEQILKPTTIFTHCLILFSFTLTYWPQGELFWHVSVKARGKAGHWDENREFGILASWQRSERMFRVIQVNSMAPQIPKAWNRLGLMFQIQPSFPHHHGLALPHVLYRGTDNPVFSCWGDNCLEKSVGESWQGWQLPHVQEVSPSSPYESLTAQLKVNLPSNLSWPLLLGLESSPLFQEKNYHQDFR